MQFCWCLFWNPQVCSASHVFLPGQDRNDDEEKITYKGGNVHVVTSKENWDQKIAEANKDGKIVS